MQNNSDIKNKIFSNMLWRFAERCGAQAIQFIVSLILARLLSPNDYGTVALVLVIAQILQVFVDSGLGNALIQKKDADELDFSSVFYFNIVWCLILYAIIFVAAPSIARFYNDNDLIAVIRVICLMVIVSGLKNVQQAYVSKTMQFKKFFYSTLAGIIVSAIVGIIMAVANYGVWALVVQKLVNILVDTIVLWVTVGWKPKRSFSFVRLKSLVSYGWKILVSSLLNKIYDNIRTIIIGKLYSANDLAYYNQGEQYPKLIITNINAAIDSVLLPTMSNEQDNRERLKSMVRRSIQVSTYVIAPLMIGLVVVAPVLIELILTEKWLECVPYLRIFCLTYVFYPIHTANLNAIQAMGRSDLFLKLEIYKKIGGLIILILALPHGVLSIAYSAILSSIISQIINSSPNKRLLDYGYLEQLKDILPAIGLACVMGILISPIELLIDSKIIVLVIQVTLGALIYVLGSAVLRLESFTYLLEIIKGIIWKGRDK